MRVITLIVIHCSAVKPDQTSSAAQIDTWHRKDRHYKFAVVTERLSQAARNG